MVITVMKISYPSDTGYFPNVRYRNEDGQNGFELALLFNCQLDRPYPEFR